MTGTRNFSLQPASPEFARVVPDLFFATSPAQFTHLVDGRRDVFERWVSGLWARTGSNFSHDLAIAAVGGGELLGFELGYSGADRSELARVGAAQTAELLDDESLAHMRSASRQGSIYLTPRIPGHAYYLMFLSVAPSARNRGIGTVLLENAFQRARDAGLRSVHLDVYDGNPAMRLYRRAGMEVLVESRVPSLEEKHRIGRYCRMVLEL